MLATVATVNYRFGVMVAAATTAEVMLVGPVARRSDRIGTVVRALLAAVLTLTMIAGGGALNLWGGIMVALAVESPAITGELPAGLWRILTVTGPPRLLTPALGLDRAAQA